ncbi:MAG TPA: DUF3472 domain-containing protein [Candidatus Limnocylindria bacterium]|nr:DUF3472 domain-containing protein [Candidatus Limnocylindria bacterium]
MRIPAFTAYIDPDPNAAEVTTEHGIRGWKDAHQKVLWFGEFKSVGKLTVAVLLRLPENETSWLKLTVGDQILLGHATGRGMDRVVAARFGGLTTQTNGYTRFALESVGASGATFGDLDGLLLDGPGMDGAHFNLEPRRNAASVHLAYPTPTNAAITAFHVEVTAVEDPVATFYMACGWRRGYLGMQVNSQTERRIIFSVWDSGNEAVDRSKVAAEDRVQLLAKGEGVYASDFGHEGTGGHSHLVYPWKTGQPQRFVVTAKPTDTNHTIYSGYWFQPEQQRWMLIASFKAPKDGNYLRGLHSFSEDFWDGNGYVRRKALYGNQWMQTADGTWTELVKATFSHDPTGRSARLDRFMGVEDGRFFLSHGGFIPGSTKFGEPFTRPETGHPPVIDLPVMPAKN